MDVLTAIKTRRSVRTFLKREIDDCDIEKIIDAGCHAPSGLNNQPWRFITVTNPEIRNEIAKQTHYGDVIKQAPLLIAVFLDNKESYDCTKDAQAVGACIQNMLLAINYLRLGGCWMGEILKNKDNVRKILEAPENYELMAVIAAGHPKEEHREYERKKPMEVTYKKWT